MNLLIINEKELKEKYKGINLDNIIDGWVNYYNKKPFDEKTKKIWIQNIKEHLIIENLDYQKENSPQENQEQVEDDNFTYIDEKGKEKVSIPKIVSHLLLKHDFKTIYGIKDEKVYFYEKGVYNLRGKEIIKTMTEELLQGKCVNNIVREVVEKIKRKTPISQEEFDYIPLNLICLENGVFNLEERKLKGFNPDYYFKSKIPIRYHKEAKCIKILDFINKTCYPEDIPVIQEFFGFCLYRKYFIKKSIILFGEKDTGKTVLMNLISKFFGEKNVAGISLQRIASKDKFALASLKDKYVNSYDDLSADDLKDAGGFKIATGGGYITAEYKFGDPFQFMTHAKNIFATNKIPNVKDINDDAYYSRWIPLCFDNRIELSEQDNFLLEKLITEKELSGLFNWALEGLDRLLQNGKFSYIKNSNEIKVIMQRQNNPLIAFIDEILQQEDGNKISKEIMYRVYSKWCQEKKVPRLSKEQLGRSLAKHTNYIVAKGGKERVWDNVKIIDLKGEIE